MLALSKEPFVRGARSGLDERPQRFRFGFIASSDNHTARAGTGYKEIERRHFTDTRMAEVGTLVARDESRASGGAPLGGLPARNPTPAVAFLENERGGSFYVTGGLVAVHAERLAIAIFDLGGARAQARPTERAVRASSSGSISSTPNGPSAGRRPMGSEVERAGTPRFRVRAAGSFEQRPGCPDVVGGGARTPRASRSSAAASATTRVSDRGGGSSAIEVVRILPQQLLAKRRPGGASRAARSRIPGGCFPATERVPGLHGRVRRSEFADARARRGLLRARDRAGVSGRRCEPTRSCYSATERGGCLRDRSRASRAGRRRLPRERRAASLVVSDLRRLRSARFLSRAPPSPASRPTPG